MHKVSPNTSQMQYNKQLLPSQMVCLREGAEIKLVIPPLQKGAFELEQKAHDAVTKGINSMILHLCDEIKD